MSTKRTTITIDEALYDRAKLVMQARLISDFSGFVQILIREEWERRFSTPLTREQADQWLSGKATHLGDTTQPPAADRGVSSSKTSAESPAERSAADIGRKIGGKTRKPTSEQ